MTMYITVNKIVLYDKSMPWIGIGTKELCDEYKIHGSDP